MLLLNITLVYFCNGVTNAYSTGIYLSQNSMIDQARTFTKIAVSSN